VLEFPLLLREKYSYNLLTMVAGNVNIFIHPQKSTIATLRATLLNGCIAIFGTYSYMAIWL
jgi:hypothetical protein